MSKAIDKFKDYASTFEVVKIHVPELKLDVFVNPITMLDRSKLLAKTEDLDNIKTSVEVIVMLAKDEKGDPLFTVGDKSTLMRLPGADELVSRISNSIMEAHTIEDPKD